MAYDYSDELILELYRDANGYRASPTYSSYWNKLTPDQKQEEWDYLCKVLEDSIQEEKIQKERAVDAYKSVIENVRICGAKNDEDAIRWLTQQEIFEHDQDVEAYVYKHGILFTDFGRDLVKTLKKIYKIH